ncbi:hypothetical protein HYH03_002665 [Edaphochlamys debaryana]|uniref:Uncharacterized protein n=1 Tax=Edaphochlamys debaryana TaxID=47281 RepID=A0A835YDR3_9CHLO|nr:hypothetical protein HYH03_002665 [Edaphochlamys debaryana]|eukprot:KAG2499732.1 hypothetical protein HYH03_002665 [Edaphochlamys debaryana]
MPPGTSPGVGGSEADGPRGQRSRDRALRNSDAGVYGEEDRLVSALRAGATPQRHSLLDSALHRQRLAQASSSGGTRMQLDYVPQKSFSRRAPSVGFAAASRPPPAAGWLSTEPLRGDPSRSGGPQGPCAPTGA